MYDLRDLIDTFIEHGKEHQKNQIELIESFKKNYPDEPLPDHFYDAFNLPLALASICSELLALKEKGAPACAQDKE